MGSATLGVGFTDELDGVLVGTDEGDTTGEAEAGGTGVDEVPGSAGFDVQATSATRAATTTAAMRVVFGTFPRSVRPRSRHHRAISEPEARSGDDTYHHAAGRHPRGRIVDNCRPML